MIPVAAAWAAAPVLGPAPVGDLRDLAHPVYVDEAGTVFRWSEVKALAAPESLRRVRNRRVGRGVLAVVFAGATAGELYGTLRLAEQGSVAAIPLGIQAAATGLGELLLWTRLPGDLRRDRAIVLSDVNGR